MHFIVNELIHNIVCRSYLAFDASLLVHHTARLFTFAAAKNGFYSYSFSSLLPCSQQRFGLLALWRSFACYFILHSALYHFVCSIDFLLSLSHFSIAKVGQASCCKGRSPYLARKSFKDFGVQLLLSPNSLRHPD